MVGLAPGLRGANRTGRAFTGDYAGDLLYATLLKFGLAEGQFLARPDDGLRLKGIAVVNAVRCVPPDNKPIGAEIATCRRFLIPHLAPVDGASPIAILALGRIAHDSVVRGLGWRLKDAPFAHGAEHMLGGVTLLSSYHCSRYNTKTGVLTTPMFEAVVARFATHLGA